MNELSGEFQSEQVSIIKGEFWKGLNTRKRQFIQKLVSIVEHKKRAINQAKGCSDVSKLNIIDKEKQRGCPLLGANRYTHIYPLYMCIYIIYLFESSLFKKPGLR